MTSFVRWVLILALVPLLTGGVACIPKTKTETVTTPADVELEVRELRLRLYEFTEQQAGTAEYAADLVQSTSETQQVRRNSLAFKANVVPALHRASFRSNALLSAVDVWLLTLQLRDWATTGEGRDWFGDEQQIIVDAVLEMEQRAIRFVEGMGGDPHGDAARRLEQFAREHPLQRAMATRTTAVSKLAEEFRTPRMSAATVAGTLVESVDDLTDRTAFYAEQLPKHLRWQIEIAMLDKGLEKVDIDVILGDLDRLLRIAEQLSTLPDDAPGIVSDSVEAVLPQLETMLESVDLDGMRGLLDELVAEHLAVTLAAVTAERLEAQMALREERELMMGDIDLLVGKTIDSTFDRVEALVEAKTKRLAPLGLVALAVPFLLGLLVGVVFRRRGTS